MIRFSLFGIPVEIQPWFWLTMALLGGALRVDSPESFLHLLVFMIVGVFSILVHEFGHALTGRRFGGGRARIVLWTFGGLAYNEGGRFTRTGRFWMIAAGPGAGLLLCLTVCLALVLLFGAGDAAALISHSLFGTGGALSFDTLAFFQGRLALFSLIHSLLWINFWWSMINLLPVPPLDGGQISELFVKPRPRVHQVAIVAAIATAVMLLTRNAFFGAALFGFLAWRNYQALQSWQGR